MRRGEAWPFLSLRFLGFRALGPSCPFSRPHGDGPILGSIMLCNIRHGSAILTVGIISRARPLIDNIHRERLMAISTWKGQRFVCLNAGGGCEMEVIKAPPEGLASNPRCGCGSVMKKPYAKPA